MNFPVPTTKAELLAILDDVRRGVESGDTLEGFVQFGWPDGQAGDPLDAEFMVLARYRVGNLQGQGGVMSVGSMEPNQLASDGATP